MTDLEKYYNKFNEEHRLETRHGTVEFTTSMKYIHEYLPKDKENKDIKILDIGAGTGRYSVALSKEGFNVTAVELVPRNLKAIEAKHSLVNCWPGDARNLSFLPENTFDLTLLFGPLYHLHSQKDQLLAIEQAKRVTKKGGVILMAYVMNEYSILTYCFKQKHIKEVMEHKNVSQDFHTIASEDELYTYVRLSDINQLKEKSNLKRLKIFAADGPADYMRRELNAMDEEEFKYFMEYHLQTCEYPELLGASSHLVDVLQNE